MSAHIEPPQHVVRSVRAGELRKLAAIEQTGDALFATHLGEEGMVDALRFPAPTGGQRDAVPGFIKVVGSPVAGFAHVIFLDGYAHLEQVSVHVDKMRQGMGAALVRAVMAEAEKQGFEELSLCTYRDLPWNGPFYTGLGFHEVTDLLPYQRRLREVEQSLGLDGAGVRVVMSAPLRPERPRPKREAVAVEPVNPFEVRPVAQTDVTGE